jgi:hypothetical protein
MMTTCRRRVLGRADDDGTPIIIRSNIPSILTSFVSSAGCPRGVGGPRRRSVVAFALLWAISTAVQRLAELPHRD